MTTAEFRAISGLPKSWKEYREKDETIKSVFSVIEDESPINIPDMCPEQDTNVRYGYTLGYAACQNKFKELATLSTVNNDPTKRKSTYGTRKKTNAT